MLMIPGCLAVRRMSPKQLGEGIKFPRRMMVA